ncbi:unnamed protein product [Mytilus coruscus]|uniref:Uncharacterized protein n=1 Tax=Mytilus coruscus TaxID=42192 RepID=A0A6J8DWE2_MYTCO|nr:unnamed protein product [Mytilus coruscus]
METKPRITKIYTALPPLAPSVEIKTETNPHIKQIYTAPPPLVPSMEIRTETNPHIQQISDEQDEITYLEKVDRLANKRIMNLQREITDGDKLNVRLCYLKVHTRYTAPPPLATSVEIKTETNPHMQQISDEQDEITYLEKVDRIANKRMMNVQVKMNYQKIIFKRTDKKLEKEIKDGDKIEHRLLYLKVQKNVK